MGNKFLKFTLFLLLYFLLFKSFSFFFNNFQKLENVIYEKELFFKAKNYDFPKKSNQKIKILAVDYRAIEKLHTLPDFKEYSSRWPWNRRIFAKILDFLKKARVSYVGVDFFFNLDSSKTLDPGQDRALVDSVKNNGRVVLAGFIDRKTKVFVKPFPALDKVALASATVDMPVDEIDNTVRRCKLLWESKDGPVYSFDYVLFHYYTGKTISDDSLKRIRYINFVGHSSFPQYFPPGKYFEIVSVYDFIKNFDYYKDEWKDTVVLLGPTDRTLHDYMRVPLSGISSSGRQSAMSGIEIHANILSNLLEDNFLKKAPQNKIIIIMAILFSLSVFWGALGSVFWLILISISYYFFAFYSFFKYNLIYPYVSLVVTAYFSFFVMAIYNYLEQLWEKDKLKNIFKQYVSGEVLEEILRDPEKLSLGGRKEFLSILFADVRGFTSFSEKHSPEEVVSVLNKMLEKIMEPVPKYYGILDKFIGDCVMLIFGAPIKVKNHAEKAVFCAFEMMEKVEEFSLERKIDLGIGIGINSAEVVIGNIGTSLYKDYTVIGDGVNLAARLESIAKKGEIIITDTVYQMVKDKVEILYQDKVKVKGKKAEILIYSVKKKIR